MWKKITDRRQQNVIRKAQSVNIYKLPPVLAYHTLLMCHLFCCFSQLGLPLFCVYQLDNQCYQYIYVKMFMLKLLQLIFYWCFCNIRIFQYLFYRPVLTPGIFLLYTGFCQGGYVFVTCDSKREGKTSMAMFTTSALSTTRSSSPSSVVSFTELIPTSAINKTNSSEELKCDHRSGIFFSIYD